MPKGYWIAHIDVTNPDGYKAYIANREAAFRNELAKQPPGGKLRQLCRISKQLSPPGP